MLKARAQYPYSVGASNLVRIGVVINAVIAGRNLDGAYTTKSLMKRFFTRSLLLRLPRNNHRKALIAIGANEALEPYSRYCVIRSDFPRMTSLIPIIIPRTGVQNEWVNGELVTKAISNAKYTRVKPNTTALIRSLGTLRQFLNPRSR